MNTFLKELLPCDDFHKEEGKRLGEIGFNTLKHNCEEKSDKRNTRERFERADERVEEGTKEEEDEDDDNRRRREGVNG